ncbi:MAG TPA: NUDIX domain-containing protein [Thermoplasmata archaeon]|nr:NUDIX domain-containing protein [Thermoplasmata archaeon]
MAGEPREVEQECVEAYLFHGRPPRLLVLRRPPVRGSLWVPVSGKVEATDPDFESALRRELREETGFRHPTRVFPLDWDVEFDGPDGRRWRLHAFGVELPEEATPELSPEHDAFAWVDADEARARLHYEDNREAVVQLIARLGRETPGGRASTV